MNKNKPFSPTISLKLPLHSLRSQLLNFMQKQSYPLYALISRRPRPEWQMQRDDLEAFPPGSLGQRLGRFLIINDLHLMPGFENHDIFHILLGYGLSAPEEVELQWCLLGNGKRSAYALVAAVVGAAFFPECWGLLQRAFRRGKALRPFHHWYYEYLLRENLADLQHFLSGGELRSEQQVY